MFGDLRDFPLTELLPMLADRRGRLRVMTGAQITSIYVLDGVVIHVEGDGLPAPGSWATQEHLFSLLHRNTEGTFTFDLLQQNALPHTVTWPIQWLLIKTLGRPDAIGAASGDPPDPDTVFVPVPRDPADLPPDWQRCLALVTPLLDGTHTVRQVAARLHVEEISYVLDQLRVLGYVQPVRRFSPQAPRREGGLLAPVLRHLTSLLRWKPT
jgi:hypothetical protein